MDGRTFDRIARLLGAASTRRRGIAAALAALGGTVAGREQEAAARPPVPKGGPWPAGPCGPAGADNRCRKDRECCTGYCRNGRCRCIHRGKPCTASQTCCGGGACANGVCPRRPKCAKRDQACGGKTACCQPFVCKKGRCSRPTVATGAPCDAAKDTCEDAAASCMAYDSDDPAGTFCLLPTGAACAAANDCWSQDCAGGACAAVACNVCATGCQWSTIDDALAQAPAGSRVKIAPGSWTVSSGSEDISRNLRIEACGGVPGVIVQGNGVYVLNAKDGASVTAKGLEFAGTSYYISAVGTGAATMSTFIADRCTFGDVDDGIYPDIYSHITMRDCVVNGSSVYAGTRDPNTGTVTITRCSFVGSNKRPQVSLGGNIAVTITDSSFKGGGNSCIAATLIEPQTATLLIENSVLSECTAKSAGGGIKASATSGGSVTVTLAGTTTVTGNTAPAGNGSGIVAITDNASTVSIVGAAGRVSGNTTEPQCARSTDGGSTYSAVAGCAY